MYQAVLAGKLSGNGEFTKRCQRWFEQRYGFRKTLLATSGTDALEMCAMLCELKPGDEVIIPSYTFVSTALAFLREGAKVVFADSMKRNPNLDAELLESLITPRTRVIVPVHYAGVACDMDAIMAVAEKHGLLVVEDAAQAIDSYYISRNSKVETRKPLGGIGHLAAFFPQRGVEPASPTLQGRVSTTGQPGKSSVPIIVKSPSDLGCPESLPAFQASLYQLWNAGLWRQAGCGAGCISALGMKPGTPVSVSPTGGQYM